MKKKIIAGLKRFGFFLLLLLTAGRSTYRIRAAFEYLSYGPENYYDPYKDYDWMFRTRR